MDCGAASDLIMKYFDKEIDRQEEELLQEHLKSCESCSMEFETLKEALFAIESMGLEEAPENLEQTVIRRIKQEDAARAKLEGRMMGAAIFTAVIAGWIGLMCLFLYTPLPDMLSVSFKSFLSLSKGLLGFVGSLWRIGISWAARFLTVGRALNIVNRAVMEIYSVLILSLLAVMVMISGLCGYVLKFVRR